MSYLLALWDTYKPRTRKQRALERRINAQIEAEYFEARERFERAYSVALQITDLD